MQKFDKSFQLMNESIMTKSLKKNCRREQLKNYFTKTYELYEDLFKFVKDNRSYYQKYEPLRHPLIFYYGHTACFFINKFIEKGIIQQSINPHMESIFAVGVDEMDWDDLDENDYDWPTVEDVCEYRQKVKQLVVQQIYKIELNLEWNSDLWIVLMGIEHQRIHLETTSVIIRIFPLNLINESEKFLTCPFYKTETEKIPKNQLKQIQAFTYEWNRKIQTTDTYGWDNEFGDKLINLEGFKASKMLVSNGEYLEFVNDLGYSKQCYWDLEGRNWLKAIKATQPLFWIKKNQQFYLRTMDKEIQLPLDWPAEVNNLEATAFCNWKGQKTGKKLRLMTEDEYFALRSLLKKDQTNWEPRTVGNINLEFWLSPSPVDMFETEGFFDIVGNVWQHCSTPIYPFSNFSIHPVYEDFTTPTFDGRHFMIKGGSFISTGNEASQFSRYAFRRHFHQFAGFRYVQSNNPVENCFLFDQNDEKVENSLRINFLEKNSYIKKIEEIMTNIETKQKEQNRCLTIGCSVGQIPLLLSKIFKQSVGTDYSARFFQMATRIVEKGVINYQNLKIQLDTDIDPTKVKLFQMNPLNLQPKKLKKFKFVVIDGVSLKNNCLFQVFTNIREILEENFYILFVKEKSQNSISLSTIIQALGIQCETKQQVKTKISENSLQQVTLTLIRSKQKND